jgi:outer membrane protein OmpA-like peptidoglycan-associated protein
MWMDTRLAEDYLLLRLRMPKERAQEGMAYFSALLQPHAYTETEVEWAKEQILKKIEMAELDPWYHFEQELNTIQLGKDAQWLNKVGNFVEVRKVNAEQLTHFAGAAQATRLVLAGDRLPEKWTELPLPHIPTWPAPQPIALAWQKPENPWNLVENEWVSQTVMMATWHFDYRGMEENERLKNGDAWALTSLALSLPGSPLVQALMETGLALNVRCEWKPNCTNGQFRCLVTPHPEKVEACAKAWRQELNRLAQPGYLSEEIWSQAQQVVKWREAMERTKTSDYVMDWVFRQLAEGPHEGGQHLKRQAQIPLDTAEQIIRKGLGQNTEMIGVLHPSDRIPDFSKLGEESWVAGADTAQVEEPGDPALPYAEILRPKVYFKPNSHEPDAESMVYIEGIAKWLKEVPEVKLYVNGYTDGLGDGVKNYHLSLERADLIMRILTEGYGIPTDRLGVRGYGEAFPDYPDDTPEHRALNRRVTFTLQEGGKP